MCVCVCVYVTINAWIQVISTIVFYSVTFLFSSLCIQISNRSFRRGRVLCEREEVCLRRCLIIEREKAKKGVCGKGNVERERNGRGFMGGVGPSFLHEENLDALLLNNNGTRTDPSKQF